MPLGGFVRASDCGLTFGSIFYCDSLVGGSRGLPVVVGKV